MRQWLRRYWVAPIATALGVAILIQILFSPGFKQGQSKVEELLNYKLNATGSATPLLFARPTEARDQETNAMYIALNNMTGYKFISYERTETKRMRFDYSLSLAPGTTITVEFILVSTDKGWLIERMRRLPGGDD